MYHEIRHNGNFVARFNDEEADVMHRAGRIDEPTSKSLAEYHAKTLFPDGAGVEVLPGGTFELHCHAGFLTSFTTREAAEMHGNDFDEKHKAKHERAVARAKRDYEMECVKAKAFGAEEPALVLPEREEHGLRIVEAE
jgi:hypothetical protein